MASLELYGGFVVLYDDADEDLIKPYKWCLAEGSNTFYARTSNIVSNPVRGMRMHRLILEPEPGEMIDHKNGNGLDNRRLNLRLATRAQNGMNRAPNRNATSRYKGVSWDNQKGEWFACIRVEGKRIRLGFHACEIEAARAYDEAARHYFREFARPNFT
jgi:hypothetical protein